MESSGEAASISELKLYQNRFSLFQILNIHNPAKLFQRFSELQNEVNFLRNENRELIQENEKLRNHFTHWYIQDGIDCRQPSDPKALIEQNSEAKNEGSYGEVSTQTHQLLDPKSCGSTNVTIRLEIVTNDIPEPSTLLSDNIKTVKVLLPKSENEKTVESESEPAEIDCVTKLIEEIEKLPEPAKWCPANEKPIKSCLLHNEDIELRVPELLIPATIENLQKHNKTKDNTVLSEGPVPIMSQTRKRSALKNIFSRSKSNDRYQTKERQIQNLEIPSGPGSFQPLTGKECIGGAKSRKPNCDCDKVHINSEKGSSSCTTEFSFNSEVIQTDPVLKNKNSFCKEQEQTCNSPHASLSKPSYSRRTKHVTYD